MQFEPKDQFEQRQRKLEKIIQAGHAAYPHEFRWTATPAELAAKYSGATAPELEANKIEAAIAGRLVSYRLMGKAGFAHVQGSGGRLQIYVRKDVEATGFSVYQLILAGRQRSHLFGRKRASCHYGLRSDALAMICRAGKMAWFD